MDARRRVRAASVLVTPFPAKKYMLQWDEYILPELHLPILQYLDPLSLRLAAGVNRVFQTACRALDPECTAPLTGTPLWELLCAYGRPEWVERQGKRESESGKTFMLPDKYEGEVLQDPFCVMKTAARAGNIPVLEWYHTAHNENHKSAYYAREWDGGLCAAASAGRKHVIQWLVEQKYQGDCGVFRASLDQRDPEVWSLLAELHFPFHLPFLCSEAISKNNDSFMHWARALVVSSTSDENIRVWLLRFHDKYFLTEAVEDETFLASLPNPYSIATMHADRLTRHRKAARAWLGRR